MKIKFCLVARLGNPDIGAHKKSEQSKQGNPFDMQHTHTGRVWESIKAKLVQDWKQSLWQNWKCLLAIYPRLRLHDPILPNIANGIFLVYKCISLILTAYNYTLSAQCMSPSVLKKVQQQSKYYNICQTVSMYKNKYSDIKQVFVRTTNVI